MTSLIRLANTPIGLVKDLVSCTCRHYATEKREEKKNQTMPNDENKIGLILK